MGRSNVLCVRAKRGRARSESSVWEVASVSPRMSAYFPEEEGCVLCRGWWGARGLSPADSAGQGFRGFFCINSAVSVANAVFDPVLADREDTSL